MRTPMKVLIAASNELPAKMKVSKRCGIASLCGWFQTA